MQIRERVSPRRAPSLRKRVALTVVEPAETTGFAVAMTRPRRGAGDTDLACGRCGLLLGIGVSSVPRTLLLECPCGALNRSC
jgi:hypothetical protein